MLANGTANIPPPGGTPSLCGPEIQIRDSRTRDLGRTLPEPEEGFSNSGVFPTCAVVFPETSRSLI
jgi:hypothetical protein